MCVSADELETAKRIRTESTQEMREENEVEIPQIITKDKRWYQTPSCTKDKILLVDSH